jgi:hypothetical protein
MRKADGALKALFNHHSIIVIHVGHKILAYFRAAFKFKPPLSPLWKQARRAKAYPWADD